MIGIYGKGKLHLDDIQVLFPESLEKYEDDDKDILIAKLHDRDRIIEQLWFEVKSYRERECR